MLLSKLAPGIVLPVKITQYRLLYLIFLHLKLDENAEDAIAAAEEAAAEASDDESEDEDED